MGPPLDAGFLQFMEAAPDAMVCVGSDGQIVLANSQAERLFGRRREDMLGHPVEILIPDRFRDRHVDHRDGFIADPHARPMGQGLDLYALHSDGSEFPVEISLSPIETGGDRIIAASIRDTSERVRAEKKFRALLDSAPDAMVIVDEGGEIVLVNAQAEAMFGHDKQDMLGRTIEMLMPSRFRERHVDHRDGFFSAPRPRAMGSGLELFALHADGSEFPVEISLSPIDTDEGRLVAAAVRDVTRRKRAEAKARAALEQERQLRHLQELDEFRTRFINAAAHELYTPLTPIAATLKILERDDVPKAQFDQARSMLRRNFDRVADLVADLLEAARFQSGRLQIDRVPTDVTALVHDVAGAFEAASKEADIELIVEAEDGVTAHLDPKRIHQTLDNLMSNALKFTPAGGRVTMRLARRDDQFDIDVEDTGVGLSQEQLQRLFTPFVRLHEDIASGTGLGLYISQGYVEAHGGTLFATSDGPSKGTCFTIRMEAS